MFDNEIKTALDGDEYNELSNADIVKNIDTSMYSSDELREQEQIVEAILFMMGDSVAVDTLATALSKDHDIALAAAERLIQKYETDYVDRGMKVIRINHKYQMVANNKYFQNLVLVASKPQKPVLTDAVLETLSIVAYKQPITKPEIEEIRGVKSDFAVNRLIEYGLIEEKGRLEAPGRPIILGTTEEFLLRFGLESTDDLPILPATREAEIKNEVEKELTETLGEPVHIDKDELDDVNDEEDVDITDIDDADESDVNDNVEDNKNDDKNDNKNDDKKEDENDDKNDDENDEENDDENDDENADEKDDNEEENIDIKEEDEEELDIDEEDDDVDETNNDDFNEVDKNLVDRYKDNINDDSTNNDVVSVDDNYDIDNNNATVSHERKDEQHDEKTGDSEDKEPQ